MRVKIVQLFDVSYHDETEVIPSGEDAPAIEESHLAKFKSLLTSGQYERVTGKGASLGDSFRYLGTTSWGLKVEVSSTEIAFTAPRTKSFNNNLIFECLQTASELSDAGEFSIYFPRENEWLTPPKGACAQVQNEEKTIKSKRTPSVAIGFMALVAVLLASAFIFKGPY